MCPSKRSIIWAVVVSLSFFANGTQVSAFQEETYFVATAYYSPIEGQSRYITGSYAGDIRLNGGGTTTASGKGVFKGLLAGPSNYPFGTKIYFEGYGIGSIEDRGGAIVKAGERGHSYDRIDIWMGYGDEGLIRAINWGKRTIKGKIIVPSADVTLTFQESELGNIEKLDVNPESTNKEDIENLQELFLSLDLYNGDIDGNYDSIKMSLINFQIKYNIITNTDDISAGWYGPKTISTIRKLYVPDVGGLTEEPKELFQSFNHKQASQKYKTILEYGDLQVNPESDSETVKQLQELLSEIGEYNGPIDGKYASVENNLIELQKKIGLIEKNNDWGAGYFGNKTKSAMWIYYEELEDRKLPQEIIKDTSLSLTQDEKETMNKAFLLVSKKLISEETKGGEKVSARLKRLSRQIDKAIPSINDPLLKLKLEYLQELISN